VAANAGLLGSMDANRGDYQNGWDTDQFPNNINELVEAMLVILEAGGLPGWGVSILMQREEGIPLIRQICFMRTSAEWMLLQER
jgi:hypothetical protein